MSHTLDLINVARPLVIPIDFIPFVRMSFRIAPHEVRVLHTAHSLTRRILTGNKIDGLGLPPDLGLLQDVLDVTYIDGHMLYTPLRCCHTKAMENMLLSRPCADRLRSACSSFPDNIIVCR